MADEKRIYPSTPLEETVATHEEQKEKLLPPVPPPQVPLQAPPTYDQTVGATPTEAGVQPTVLVITQPSTIPFGPEPVDIQCPFCHNQIRTRIRYLPTTRTHLVAALLCLFQLYCCVCLPYCLSSCMNTQHYCGMCDRYLGTYQRQ